MTVWLRRALDGHGRGPRKGSRPVVDSDGAVCAQPLGAAGGGGAARLDGGVAGYGPTIRALYVIDGIGFALAIAALAVDKPA